MMQINPAGQNYLVSQKAASG
ncbi:hypothetical protein CSPAE12_05392 [Colletotrichum incanum]|nr:hypothetical protein CSPAE12_05392 [Colletotrichum incanum]